jgi:exodeoxyribonuclease-3
LDAAASGPAIATDQTHHHETVRIDTLLFGIYVCASVVIMLSTDDTPPPIPAPRAGLAHPGRLRVVSWNVNGLRACARKGFLRWLRAAEADIVGLQEVRALPEDLAPRVRAPRSWHTCFSVAERRGYSGVGLFSRMVPDWVRTTLEQPEFDREGRLQVARFGRLLVANVYFPKGSGPNRDNSRIPYKLAFSRAVFDAVERCRRQGLRVLVMGDWNTAHREVDLAFPKSNVDNSGFRPEERAEIDRWLGAGWIDAFRRFESGPGHYTWWSQRKTVRERNIGWRIDFVLASRAVMPFVEAAFIRPDVRGSNHCPIGIDLDPSVLD